MKTAITQFEDTRPAQAQVDQMRADPSFDQGLRRHMLRVYNYMCAGLVITGVVAYVVGTTPALYDTILAPPLLWVAIFAPLAFILIFSFSINAISAPAAQSLFWTFCALMGLGARQAVVWRQDLSTLTRERRVADRPRDWQHGVGIPCACHGGIH